MSQLTVGIVIDKLFTDEDLRVDFVVDPTALTTHGSTVLVAAEKRLLERPTACDLLPPLLAFLSVAVSAVHPYDACGETI